jgi:DMSO/TMAO reductase YedYZ molybdopterin-dependent catalytic subunit
MVRLHYYSIISFALLLLTGIALFWPPVHAVLIAYLPVIYDVHVALGLIFAVTLLTPFVVKGSLKKWIRRLDWLFPLLLGAMIVVTGFMVWRVTWFPTTWRSVAFHWHGNVSYTLGAWLMIHAIYKAVGYRPSQTGLNPRVDPERRMFLRWLGTGVAGAVVITAIDPVTWLTRALQFGAKAGAAADGSGFAAFYTVTDGYPSTDLSTYRLKVDGLVKQPAILTWPHVLALTQGEETTDFHCVTGWSVPNVRWEGVHIQTLVSLVQPTSAAKYVHFYSLDGVYTESLSLAEALDPTVMLAHKLDGQPLAVKQGYPLRLVVPKMYGYKSIKWLSRVEFSDRPLTGYWEVRGYPNEAYLNRGI